MAAFNLAYPWGNVLWFLGNDPGFRAGIAGFLEATTGADDGGRAEIALAAIERLRGRQVA